MANNENDPYATRAKGIIEPVIGAMSGLKKMPLFLPEGSIRAILTLGITFFTCWVYAQGLGDQLPAYWEFVFVGAISAYFGSRLVKTK
jgi:hypothetical protein